MKPKVLIFDVYGTLLEVGPPPADADGQWTRLWKEILGVMPRLSRLDFAVACSREVVARHECARGLGIHYPEVSWPAIAQSVVPELCSVPTKQRELFILRQMGTGHTTRLFGALVELLPAFKRKGYLLGIASNAQAYTLTELEWALGTARLDMTIFDPELMFWSYQHGFAKPDPHVFQILTARLEHRGIMPAEALMVGDRQDNDVDPPARFGWQTWWLTDSPGTEKSGSWEVLGERLMH